MYLPCKNPLFCDVGLPFCGSNETDDMQVRRIGYLFFNSSNTVKKLPRLLRKLIKFIWK